MAEEQRWHHRPCANNCGFFGSPTTLNLCSKCYKDKFTKEQQQQQQQPLNDAMEATLRHLEPLISTPPPPSASLESAPPAASKAATEEESSGGTPNTNRCGACRKRVGLVGFTCRCGVTFCGSHRYPEKHACGFDYKTVGREAIARANPVIKGTKLDKI